MHLDKLLEGLEISIPDEYKQMNIQSVAYDSRKVKEGSLFICVTGFLTDGHKYVGEAEKQGAICILAQKEGKIGKTDLPVLYFEDTRIALSRISANYFGHPSRELRMIGITGTNGKTTVSYLLKSIFEEAGTSSGLIGTIAYQAGGEIIESVNTTPESYEVQKMLRNMADGGNLSCVMEVSSHALELHRVDDVDFDYGIFTNLTEDHLDFHPDFESYYQAKKKLFYLLKEKGLINIDDDFGKRMYEELKQEEKTVLSYSVLDMTADYYAKVMEESDRYSLLEIYKGEKFLAAFQMNTPGRFSIYNGLASFAAAFESGIEGKDIIKGIEAVKGVPGRFELVSNNRNMTIIVDYAHTPDALIKVLDAATEFKKGRLICVFGCGGDRDRAKRSMMGEAAGKRCDYCIITSDNPRTEDPKKILDEIETGIQKTTCVYNRIEDRRQAIEEALKCYQAGDVIIIAGKGHETYQIIGKTKQHFDDREVVSEFLEKSDGRQL